MRGSCEKRANIKGMKENNPQKVCPNNKAIFHGCKGMQDIITLRDSSTTDLLDTGWDDFRYEICL